MFGVMVEDRGGRLENIQLSQAELPQNTWNAPALLSWKRTENSHPLALWEKYCKFFQKSACAFF